MKLEEEPARPKLMKKTWGVNGEIKGTLKTIVGIGNAGIILNREKRRDEREREREREREQ